MADEKTREVTNTGQLVPETILKRRHDLDELNAKIAANEIKNPRISRKIYTKKPIKVIRPDKIILRHRAQINNRHRFVRVLNKGMQTRASDKLVTKTKVISGENKDEKAREVTYQANSVEGPLLFAIRVRGNSGTPKHVLKTLARLRLFNQNQGVFHKNTKSTLKMLQLVDPYVIYGIPSKQTVTDLIKRRGHAKIKGERIPLSDNTVIEEALGEDTGIICVEDLVEELVTAGGNFYKAARFIYPFNLAALRSRFQKKILNEQDGRDYGDIGAEMDAYIRSML